MELPISIIISAVITIFIGVLASLIAEKLSEKAKLEKDKLEELLSSSEVRAEEAKLLLIQALSEKLPQDIKPEELSEKLSSQLKIAGDIVINNVIKQDSQLIEELVNSYHRQALSQARVQFWFSVIAATVGFAYILYSASGFSPDNLGTILKTLPGVVIDAVALLFFRQAEQTRQRATELYDRLRSDSQAVMAKELLSTIEDKKIKSIAQAQIALHLSGVKTIDFDVSNLIENKK